MSSAAEVVAFKLTAALELLRADKIAFDTTHEMLCKVVENIVKAPAEPKYRKLRTTNEKINALLLAPGACQLLLGCGFVEDGEFLVLPEAAAIEPLAAALSGLRANQEAKREEGEATKRQEVEQQRARAMSERRAQEPPGPKAKASHILLNASAEHSFDSIEKRMAGWKAILDDAPYHNQEHDFAELAKAHSECPSAARGGALGFFPKGKMVDEFDAVCFEKKTKAIYGPVRTATGVHLIFLHARTQK